MIILESDHDSKGTFVSVIYRDKSPDIYAPKFTLMWIDESGCQLTKQYHTDDRFNLDFNGRVLVTGVDTI